MQLSIVEENDIFKIESPACRVVADTRELTRDEWLAIRNDKDLGGIGGSEAAGCFDPPLTKYSSRMIVVMTKLGLMPPIEDNDNMKHGRRMEPVLRREFPSMYQEVTGIEVHAMESPFLYKSIERPHLIANIDGVVIKPGNLVGGLEIKAVGYDGGWTDDEVPDMYYAQIQHYMYVLGLEFFFAAVLINRHFEFREVPRNQDFINAMLQAEDATWEYVLRGEIPAPSGVDAEDDALLSMYPNEFEKTVDLADMVSLRDEYRELIDQENTIKARKKEIANQVKARLGEAKYGVFGPMGKAVWSRFDVVDFDQAQFAKDNPELFKVYSSTKPSGRLLIK